MIRAALSSVNGATRTGDEELMAAVRGGSRTAFEQLFQRYRQPVWAFFRRRVRDASASDDLAQSVFAALLEAAPRYQPRAPFRSYLFGIAFNVLQSDRRKQMTHAAAPLEDDLSVSTTGDPARGLWVRAALAQLDPEDCEMVMLREYEGLSYQEIAHLRQLPLNTVKSRLFRARMALRQLLTADGLKEEQAR